MYKFYRFVRSGMINVDLDHCGDLGVEGYLRVIGKIIIVRKKNTLGIWTSDVAIFFCVKIIPVAGTV